VERRVDGVLSVHMADQIDLIVVNTTIGEVPVK
jgi:hypothetical protein